MRTTCLRDIEAEAKRVLDPSAFDFFAGGADDEVTLRANEAAWGYWDLLPRVLRGKGSPRASLALLGEEMAMPVLMAPTAFQRLAHPDGETATARAAAAAGVTLIVSQMATTPLEDVAGAITARTGQAARFWFQIYPQPDAAFTRNLVRRAEDAGCRALVVTVDSPVFGHRERDVRHGFHQLPAGLACENMRDRLPDGTWGDARPLAFSPALSWDHWDEIRQATRLPLLAKGILHPDDAVLARRHGADGIIVSNHGGRQLDGVPAALAMLPDIAAAVGGDFPLVVDGGVRRGTDIVKALALGARAVAIGRPVLWGLAAGGEDGVGCVLSLLRAECERAMALCGCGSVGDIHRGLVRARPGKEEV